MYVFKATTLSVSHFSCLLFVYVLFTHSLPDSRTDYLPCLSLSVVIGQWALAKDATGNFYYYNMANSSLTVEELPDITDMVS